MVWIFCFWQILIQRMGFPFQKIRKLLNGNRKLIIIVLKNKLEKIPTFSNGGKNIKQSCQTLQECHGTFHVQVRHWFHQKDYFHTALFLSQSTGTVYLIILLPSLCVLICRIFVLLLWKLIHWLKKFKRKCFETCSGFYLSIYNKIV